MKDSWISVEDRLPDTESKYNQYLVCWKITDRRSSKRNEPLYALAFWWHGYFDTNFMMGWNRAEITHWQPLVPPVEDDELVAV